MGPPDCSCGWTVPRCDACLRWSEFYQRTTAWIRGEDWAKSVAARVGTAKPWPAFGGDAEAIARRKVRDLAGGDERIADMLARACHEYAATTWKKLGRA